MPAVVHVLCGPAQSGKTQQLLLRAQAVRDSGPGTVLWLSPTRRHVVQMRPYLFHSQALSLAAKLMTFQEFAEAIIRVNDPSSRPFANLHRRLLADDLVSRLNARGELSHFQPVIETRGFAETVFDFLAELKRNEIWPEQFAEAMERLSRHRSDSPGFSKERQAARLYTAYQEALIQQRLYDQEGRFWYARDFLTRRVWRPFEALRVVFLDGFTDFTRTQHEMLAALADRLDEMWITLPNERGDERAELFTRSRAALARLQPLQPAVEYLPPLVAVDAPVPVLIDIASAGPGPAQKTFVPDQHGTIRSNGAERDARFDRTPATKLAKKPCSDVARPERERSTSALCCAEQSPSRPAGLAHVERSLFCPARSLQRSENAEGIFCLEAPGMLGETRMVARAIKALLLEGVPAFDILLTVRDVVPYADLFREVFAEYGIAIDLEGAEPLQRNPAMAMILRAVRLPDEEWPFAAVTALLRNTYFQPDWAELAASADLALRAEALLRLLGEPRGRDAYLKAVDLWADRPPSGLVDEQAEESRRQRTHELAILCRVFLQRFFRAWDDAPPQATLQQHVTWFRRFADDLGVIKAAAADARDRAALQRLWDELDHWIELEQRWHGKDQKRERRWFLRALSALAAETGLARTPRGPGRVRVLSAPLARTLTAPYVFLMGLGERSFPRLGASEMFVDEAQRQALRQTGLDFACADEQMADEMLLFYQVVTRATSKLVLSYPAVDDQGQALLPSMFLSALLQCFQPSAIPVERQRMLIERYDRLEPRSPAEYRVQVAAQAAIRKAAGADSTEWLAGVLTARTCPLPRNVAANLTAAAEMTHLRLQSRDFHIYDGLIRHPAAVAELKRLFGPDKIYSPTALEDYVTCPFRFFLGHALHLQPLEEPSEEIESSKRGAAFHRALSRLHEQLSHLAVHQPDEVVDEHLRQHLETAVEEYAVRASPASAVLWRLEGRRLQRLGERYRPHWDKFVKPWLAHGITPRPDCFEVAFGMPARPGEVSTEPLVITVGDVEVRLRGRIDRVDTAPLQDGTGFWIIDYKTGRSSSYTGSELQTFQRLQLTLYALAVERVLLADKNARPLGLAYWLVTESGAKVVLPYRDQFTWFNESAEWRTLRETLMHWVATLVTNIRLGTFPLKPRAPDCTSTCDFSQVCRITQARSVEKTWELPLPTLP